MEIQKTNKNRAFIYKFRVGEYRYEVTLKAMRYMKSLGAIRTNGMYYYPDMAEYPKLKEIMIAKGKMGEGD